MLNNKLDSADIAYIASKHMNYLVSTKVLKAGNSIVEGANYSSIASGYLFASWGNYLSDGVKKYHYETVRGGKGLATFTYDGDFPTGLNEMVFNTYPSNEDEPIDPDSQPPEPDPVNLILTQVLIDDYKARHFVLKDMNGIPLTVGEPLNSLTNSTSLHAWADDGYYFENTLNLNDSDSVNYPFNITVNTSHCTLSGNLQDKIIERLTGEAIIKPGIEYTKISAQNIIDFANSNVRVYLDGVEAVEGSKLAGVEFKAICDTGFKFTDDSAWLEVTSLGHDAFDNVVETTIKSHLLLNVNYYDATIKTDDINYTGIVLNTILDDVQPISGLNSIYLINNSILKDVNENRFANYGDKAVDFGVYILKLLKFPFDVPVEVIDVSKNIKLLTLDTHAEAPTLKSEVFKIDLGVINVLSDNNNLLDYSDKVAMLHLPFSQPMELDLNYVINETISIEYLISVYTGEATINISSSKLHEVVSTSTTKIGFKIPYIADTFALEITNDGIDVGGNNGVTRPYIEIIETDKMLADGFYTIPIIDESVLTGQSGFIKVEDINLKSKASKQNKDLLISLLKDGVIIN